MPTPEDLKNITLGRVKEVLAVIIPFIDNNLIRRANDFFSNKKVSINLKYMTSSEIDTAFELESHFRDYSSSNNINRVLARQLIVYIKEEYKKQGWSVISTEQSYNLTFKELEGWNKTISDDDSVTRSELIDLEE